jgi:hypothetical protein
VLLRAVRSCLLNGPQPLDLQYLLGTLLLESLYILLQLYDCRPQSLVLGVFLLQLFKIGVTPQPQQPVLGAEFVALSKHHLTERF